MKNTFILSLLVIVPIAAVLVGISNRLRPKMPVQKNVPTTKTISNTDKKIKISASFYPLAFVAHEIGGDRVQIFTATPLGIEPHDYDPSGQDIATITESDILLLNGASMEPWGDNIKKITDPQKTAIITMSDGMDEFIQKLPGEKPADGDPHFWLAPYLYLQMAQKTARALVTADQKNSAYYEQNLNDFSQKLAALDQDFKNGLAQCEKRDFITSHDAFGYLAAEWNLRQMPIAGLSPDAEPSPKELANISQFAKEKGIKYIFFESMTSPKLSETLAKEIGAQTLVLNPIEGLSEEDTRNGKDYFTEMRNNLINLQTALECTP